MTPQQIDLDTWLLRQAARIALIANCTPWPLRSRVRALHMEFIARAREAAKMRRTLDEIVDDAREQETLAQRFESIAAAMALADLDRVVEEWRR